jgi:ubiquinone/menaquinone biosynthesis C-methylase UbiE
MTKFYRYFLDGIPTYLVRYYWWAYLWSTAVWFFDHQPIINAILFGQYKKLMNTTLARLEHAPRDRVLQLTCVYGSLTPSIIQRLSPVPLHITDVASIQLELARSKAKNDSELLVTRMNAEQLGYKANSFSTIVLFFLLHEMPAEARRNTLSECMRTISHGGSLLMTEYGPLPESHMLYRFPPSRWLITRLEPFLDSFWHEDVLSLLQELAASHGKSVEVIAHESIFATFYRVTEFRISRAD